MESFNGRLRDECLNETVFTSLRHARTVLVAWQRDYNQVRPHGAIGNIPPAALMTAGGAFSPLPERVICSLETGPF